MEEIKLTLSRLCHENLNQKLERLLKASKSLKDAAGEDTKSSAGDKYETGRAMFQQEMDKLDRQIFEIKKQKANLDAISFEAKRDSVQLGSLVTTNQGNFFIAVAVGKIEVDNQFYFAVSAESPLAIIMKGRIEGAVFTFINKEYKILTIC